MAKEYKQRWYEALGEQQNALVNRVSQAKEFDG
jgi:hypothetical protein